MSSGFATGQRERDFSDLERAILMDAGLALSVTAGEVEQNPDGVAFEFDVDQAPEFAPGTDARSALERAAWNVAVLLDHDARIGVEVITWGAPEGQPAIRASQEDSVRHELLGGIDLERKITLRIDPSMDWGFGSEIGDDEYDFASYAARELAFSVGLGTDLWLEAPVATNPDGSVAFESYVPNAFDRQVIGYEGQRLVERDASERFREKAGVSGLAESSFVYFAGESAVAANQNEPVRLATGFVIDGELDQFFGMRYLDKPGSIMDFRFEKGDRPDVFGAVERAILQDVGLSLAQPLAEFGAEGMFVFDYTEAPDFAADQAKINAVELAGFKLGRYFPEGASIDVDVVTVDGGRDLPIEANRVRAEVIHGEPTAERIRLTIDTSHDWSYGSFTGANEYDFDSYVMRELALAIGFGSEAWAASGGDLNGHVGDRFDRGLHDGQGSLAPNGLIDPSVANGPVFFSGRAVRACAGGSGIQ